jgi:hypothetical protein
MDWLDRWIGGEPADPKALETAYSWTGKGSSAKR